MKKLAIITMIILCMATFSFAALNPDYVSPVVTVVKNISPAVVNIEATGKNSVQQDQYDDFFFKFFGGELPNQNRTFTSLGTGFIFDKTGYIITNQHVVENADKITVSMSSGTKLTATYVGGDKDLDIAIIKVISNETFPALEFGDSDKIDIGEWAIAIGNPLGLKHTVTLGVVSATNRKLQKPDGTGYYIDLIQTDAAINPGNSGGPLVNIHGQVIGINTVIINPQEGVNLGFAIPINIVKRFANTIITSGKIEKAYLGVYMQNLTDSLKKALGITLETGIYISDVDNDSPASKYGIKAGDVITKLDNKEVSDISMFSSMIKTYSANTKVTLSVFRDGKEFNIEVVLGVKGTQQAVAPKSSLGMLVRELVADDFSQYKLPKGTTGVLITQITGSYAKALGLAEGDVIQMLAIDKVRYQTTTLKEWDTALSTLKKDSNVAIFFVRKNQRYTASFNYQGEQ